MMEASDFTVVALKEMCKRIKLSLKGNKADLIERLDEFDPSGAWRMKIQNLESSDEEGAVGPLEQRDLTEQEIDDEREVRQESVQRDGSWRGDRSSLSGRSGRQIRVRNAVGAEIMNGQEIRQQNSNNNYGPSNKPINAISELVSEFSGERNTFWRWEKQFNLVRTIYMLDENLSRVILGLKLKGQALRWFHSKPEHLEISIKELLDEMRSLFDYRPAKVELRRQFEKRTWKNEESFSTYFYDKVILAGQVPVNEDELVDHIIDGIPDKIMQNQARMHCFDKKDELLRAFEQITLRPEKKWKTDRENVNAETVKNKGQKSSSQRKDDIKVEELKCFNCNQPGHRIKDCVKPKREKGSCYECGVQGHVARDCLQKKKKTTSPPSEAAPKPNVSQISNVTEQSILNNEYLEIVDFEKNIGMANFRFCVDTQLDTASPISLIKEKLIPGEWIENNSREQFEGINGSVLAIKGIIKLNIIFGNVKAENVTLRVVANTTMKQNVLLGRDALRILGFGLVKISEIKESNEKEEILNIEPSIFYGDEKDKLDINPEMLPEVKEQIKNKIETVYLASPRPELPKIKAELHLNIKSSQPFYFTPSRLSYDEKNKLRNIIDDLEKRKIIRPSNSEYASRTVLVKKRNGSLRMCIDYRSLNKITDRDNYPLPIIEDQIDALRGKRYFSLLDLKDGFHHVFMADNSVKYTAFITPFGQYEYLRMPFGLKNAPSRFQRFVNEVLKSVIETGNVVVYIDDFLIATETIEKHYEILEKVFRLLIENLLELRLDKCHFMYEKIEFLGYLVSVKGIRPTDSGVQAVRNFPTPKNTKEVHSFVGLCSYFRKYIQNFSVLAAPLYALLKKGVTFEFGLKQMESFELLKEKLTEAPTLAIYNPKDETELHCDASSQGFGAVLMQKKSDNKFHPLFYFSKKTSEVEVKYHSYELETLAIIYALKRFRIYLQGIPFKIVTDCNALIMTLNKKDINPRIARWALELQNYDYVTEHRSGDRMPHVDALSRINYIMVLEDNTFEFNLSVCQENDPKIKDLKIRLEKAQDPVFEMRNGIIYRKKGDRLLFYVPCAMEQEMLYKYHNDFGHFGIDKTYAILQENYWFPNMKEKIKNHINNCIKCIAYVKNTGKTEGLIHHIPKGDIPFMTIHIDHYGPVDRTHASKRYVLVTIDAFTKYVRFYAVKSTTSKEVIKCLRDYFQVYSRPKRLISDRGTCFTSLEFTEFMKEMNINHILVATASPQANGQVERINRILGPALGKLYDGKNWFKSLNEIEFAINNSPNRSTGKTPSQLLFGISQRGIVMDELKEYLEEENKLETRDLCELRTKASDRIRKVQEYNENYVNKKRKQAQNYETDDLVMIRNFDNSSGKLAPAFKGPFKVIKKLRNDRYVIGDVEGFQLSQRPYIGVWEAANMKPWRTHGIECDF